MLATASAQVCVPLGHSSLYFSFVDILYITAVIWRINFIITSSRTTSISRRISQNPSLINANRVWQAMSNIYATLSKHSGRRKWRLFTFAKFISRRTMKLTFLNTLPGNRVAICRWDRVSTTLLSRVIDVQIFHAVYVAWRLHWTTTVDECEHCAYSALTYIVFGYAMPEGGSDISNDIDGLLTRFSRSWHLKSNLLMDKVTTEH